MKKILQYSLMAFVVLFISSCASTSKAPESKSAEAKEFTAPAENGRVYLYRTGRAVGASGQLAVSVNATAAGGTGPGTFFKWDLKPGTYTFSSSTGEASAVVQIEVKKGEVYFIRQDARLGIDKGRVSMKEVDAKKGMNEVKACKLLVSSYLPE